MKMMKKKYAKPLLITLICLIAIGAGYFWLSSRKEQKASASSAQVVMPVEKGSIINKASGTGNIASSVRKEIKTLDNGIVDEIFVEEGQSVQEGDKILTFQNEQAESQLESARLSLEIQENKLAELNRDLAELKVYAPAAGVVGAINTEEGEDVSGGFALTSITDKKSLEITGVFNAAQIKHIRVGNQAQIVLIDSFATIKGTVTDVGTSPVDSSDSTVGYEVTVVVPNQGGLSAGMTAQVTVTSGEGSYQAADSATLENKSPKTVSLKTGGTVQKLYVEEGDTVKKGDLLASLESQSLANDIKTQKLEIEQSRLNLQEVMETMDDMVVYAPISGVISEVDVTAGERVSENSTVAVVSDMNALELVIPVDELDINNVTLGMPATITVNSVPDTEFKAAVTEIAKEGTVENGVATFDVTLTLKNIEGLKPGMSATGEVIITQKENILTVPVEAIQQRGKEKFVLVRKEGKDEPVVVKVGLVSEEMAEITEGLKEGDQVVYTLSSADSNSRSARVMMMGPGPGGGSGGGNRTGSGRSGN
ncbi:efflux RND transporter periplasmic adaptor subunit [Candidatus Formimonas warabiya]|uniref:Efflux RND transporter periplasmic adaptor subunit n=1 Tax=Formimonas warabiya TaxID=1761012 RepID=A0A3G1KPK5_FORW1|nr:efflux RND transporter periplasmic adaptor subunit [Candidatus Formimonas warabiya]ATW24391.1 hypothetical protein DCMF_05965 [Candidatus Formimonas warabiya]